MKLGNIYYLTSIDLLQPFSTKSNFYPLVDIWQCLETFFIIIFFDSRERGRELRETLINCLLYTPQPGTKPTAQACTLTRNQTGDLLIYGMTLQPIEPHQPGLETILVVITNL